MKKRIKDIVLKEISFFTSVIAASIIVIISAGILILYFRNDPDMANAFGTLATIILASVAITAIWYSSQQNKSLREENQKNTEIQHRKDLLNEIKNWATDIANFTIEPEDIEIMKMADREREWRFLLLYWSRALEKFETSGESLKRRSVVIWSNMDSLLGTVLTDLKNTISFLVHSPTPDMKRYGEAIKLVYKLIKSAKEVIEEVDNIEIKGMD